MRKPMLLLLALTMGAACSQASAPAAPSAAQTPAEAPLRVAVHRVQTGPVPKWTPVTGTLIGERRTQLSANASGRVITTCVERGAAVQQNQVLLVLDVRQARHAALEAAANMRNVQAQRTTTAQDCRRYEALYQKQAISQQEYEQRMLLCRELDAQFEAAEVRAAEATRTLKDGQVRAPFAGVVSERMVQVGDFVRQDSPVVALVVPDPLRLRCAVPESQAGFVQADNTVRFAVAAYPDKSFAGKVRYISGEVREQSRDLVFEALVPNPERLLLPGMFATGRLYAGEEQKPLVPLGSVLAQGDRHVVFVIDKGALRKHLVRLGEPLAQGQSVPIDEGLQAGALIAAQPQADWRDGQPVAQEP